MSSVKKIGTHNGCFHCDEALACFMLKTLPEYKDAEIVRSRDESILKECDIVVDVGGVYDPSIHRYDHHQREFNHSMNSLAKERPWTVKLSSAGLIYHHFGEKVIESVLGKKVESELLDGIFRYVYQNFIQEIDGIDNGVPMYEGEPKYKISTNLSARVGHLYPYWNATGNVNENERFGQAMDLAGSEFIECINFVVNSWWPARSVVKEAISKRYDVHESGEIIELSVPCPWKEHLFELEEKDMLGPIIKFVLFKDSAGGCRVQAVPVQPSSFVCRVFLADQWQGLRNEELCSVSGIEGCIFVHSTGFIGGNKTRHGSLLMAIKSLELNKKVLNGTSDIV